MKHDQTYRALEIHRPTEEKQLHNPTYPYMCTYVYTHTHTLQCITLDCITSHRNITSHHITSHILHVSPVSDLLDIISHNITYTTHIMYITLEYRIFIPCSNVQKTRPAKCISFLSSTPHEKMPQDITAFQVKHLSKSTSKHAPKKQREIPWNPMEPPESTVYI